MDNLIENGTFILNSKVAILNDVFITETVSKKSPVECSLCKEIAYGYDDQGIPWCYTPGNHPDNIQPIRVLINYD